MLRPSVFFTAGSLLGLLVSCGSDESSGGSGSGTTETSTVVTGSATSSSTSSSVTSATSGATTTSGNVTTSGTSSTTGGGCSATQEMCGGACVEVASDTANCGGCDNACALGQICTGGVCVTADATSTTGTSTTGFGMTSTATSTSTTTSTTGGAGGATATSTTDSTATSASTTGGDDGDCMTPPLAPAMIGWATQGGGTTGGGDGTPVVVTNASEFSSAAGGTDARVIYVNGSLSGDLSIGSNKTVVGICGAEIRGSLHVSNQQNVIVRNLKVVGYNCSDSPNDCSNGQDAIHVQGSQHVWFDHLDVSDGSDGNLDMTHNSDYITISWTKFWYSTARTDPDAGASGHRFSNLIGASDTDSGEYRITFHHNWWADNVNQRMPRSRFGDIHVYNNLFTASGNLYCTNAGISTHLLVENNIYRGVNNPLSPDGNGDMRAVGNVFQSVTGNQSDNGGVGFDPPYDYTLAATDGLDTTIQAEVGPHD